VTEPPAPEAEAAVVGSTAPLAEALQ
jgi:hypothetical protein